MPYVRYAVGGLLFFLILFIVVRPLIGDVGAVGAGADANRSGGLGVGWGSRHDASLIDECAGSSSNLDMARRTTLPRPPSS